MIDTDGAKPRVNFGPKPRVPDTDQYTYDAGNSSARGPLGVAGRVGYEFLTGLRGLAGGFMSIATGDLFSHRQVKTDYKGCDALIVVNGIWNTYRQADLMSRSVAKSPRYQGAEMTLVYNSTRYFGAGDVVQILAEEGGLITTAANDVANQIRAAYEAFRRNKCKCARIQVFAHSQGSMVV